MDFFKSSYFYFNTSHVTVNPHKIAIITVAVKDFNTSHVTVNPVVTLSVVPFGFDFNTSHVTVNHRVDL